MNKCEKSVEGKNVVNCKLAVINYVSMYFLNANVSIQTVWKAKDHKIFVHIHKTYNDLPSSSKY